VILYKNLRKNMISGFECILLLFSNGISEQNSVQIQQISAEINPIILFLPTNKPLHK